MIFIYVWAYRFRFVSFKRFGFAEKPNDGFEIYNNTTIIRGWNFNTCDGGAGEIDQNIVISAGLRLYIYLYMYRLSDLSIPIRVYYFRRYGDLIRY